MIHSVYNSLLTNYSPRTTQKSNTNRNFELRIQYENIMNMSNRSPLYIVKDSKENYSFGLDIKESSIALNSALSNFCEGGNGSVFAAKKAYSEHENLVSASIINETDYSQNELTIKVNSLACPQINHGDVLNCNSFGPKEGAYRFTIEMNENLYEFQFNIPQNSRNHEILPKLANFINQSNIGIEASSHINNSNNTTFLSLKSVNTGSDSDVTFSLTDTSTPFDRIGIVDFYGLNKVSSYPQNSQFEINGETASSKSNTLVLDHSLQITLHNTTEQNIKIYTALNDEKILQGVYQFTNAYNNIIDLAYKRMSNQGTFSKLLNDYNKITTSYFNELESCGISSDKDGRLFVDESLTLQSAKDGDIRKLFTSEFTTKFLNMTKYITTNPIEYLDKIIVIYPNFSKPGLPNPYITSAYSGMFFNDYC